VSAARRETCASTSPVPTARRAFAESADSPRGNLLHHLLPCLLVRFGATVRDPPSAGARAPGGEAADRGRVLVGAGPSLAVRAVRRPHLLMAVRFSEDPKPGLELRPRVQPVTAGLGPSPPSHGFGTPSWSPCFWSCAATVLSPPAHRPGFYRGEDSGSISGGSLAGRSTRCRREPVSNPLLSISLRVMSRRFAHGVIRRGDVRQRPLRLWPQGQASPSAPKFRSSSACGIFPLRRRQVAPP
jgi:hypothetical protein